MNLTTILTIVLLLLSTLLTITILLQESKSDGLSGSIAGGAEQLFGTKRAKPYEALLHRLTIILAVLTFILAIGMNFTK